MGRGAAKDAARHAGMCLANNRPTPQGDAPAYSCVILFLNTKMTAVMRKYRTVA